MALLFRSILFASICFVFLSGCALSPLYRTQECSTSALTVKVKTDSEATENYTAFKLKNLVEQKRNLIDPHLKGPTTLIISVGEEFASVAMSASGDSLRNQGRVNVSISLQDGKSTKTARLDSVSSYNLTELDEFTSQNANQATRERLLIELSEQIIRETLYLLS